MPDRGAGARRCPRVRRPGLPDSNPLRLGAFVNVNLDAKPREGQNWQFQNGALDLYLTAKISDRWSGLAEVAMENDGGETITDIERFVVSYERSNQLRVDVGRVHSPIVQWNLTQHHGLFMQTPIERPAMARFEDEPELWPVHSVGVFVSGKLLDALGLLYRGGVANGRGSTLDEVQVAGDRNRPKAVVASLGLAPAKAQGLEAVATAYFDTIPAVGGPLRERDISFSLTYKAHGLEVRSEWGRMFHQPAGAQASFETTGSFVVVSERLRGRLEAVRPYLVVDRLEVAEGESFLEGALGESSVTAGLRWDISSGVALKGEYRSERRGDGPRASVVRFQLAGAF